MVLVFYIDFNVIKYHHMIKQLDRDIHCDNPATKTS